MSLQWIHENPPYWDRSKADIIGKAPEGTFDLRFEDGDILPGEWWRVERDGTVAGYGWMDTTWGDAEILLAVAPDRRGAGIGTFILDQLENEARSRGLNYLYNEVPSNHPDPGGITRWLQARRFAPSHGEGLLRRSVHATGRSE
jgi:GNAT superfamily N-acetyltransferase